MAFVMSLMLTMNTEVFAYQGENEWYDIKDFEISLTLPEGSEVTEYSDRETETDGHILLAEIPVGENGSLQMDLYYSATNYEDEYIYFHSDREAAYEYFNNMGAEAIEDFYGDHLTDEYELTLERDGFFEGDDTSFVRAIAEIKEGNDDPYKEVVYITGNTTSLEDMVVNKMFFFSEEDGTFADTEAHRKVEESCLNDFYDTYDDTFVGYEPGWDDDEYIDDVDAGTIVDVLCGLIPLVILLCLGYALLKRKRENAKAAHKHVAKAKTTKDKIDISEWKPVKAVEALKDNRTKESERLCGEFVPKTDSEQRYYQSLLALRKSGLLTKSEMSDMLVKHAEVKARQQR